MAKFKAGDMITGTLTMSDGTPKMFLFLVNRIVDVFGGQYSLDDGDGFIDGRLSIAEVDANFVLCN